MARVAPFFDSRCTWEGLMTHWQGLTIKPLQQKHQGQIKNVRGPTHFTEGLFLHHSVIPLPWSPRRMQIWVFSGQRCSCSVLVIMSKRISLSQRLNFLLSGRVPLPAWSPMYVRTYWLFQPWESEKQLQDQHKLPLNIFLKQQMIRSLLTDFTQWKLRYSWKSWSLFVKPWKGLKNWRSSKVRDSSRNSLNLVFLSRTTWREPVPDKTFTLWIVH